MAQAALSKEQDYYTDLPVGEILRRARVHYGRSIADVERDLRIRAEQINAIETGNLEELPARVYAIGFVRSYAEYLGLDAGVMVGLFKEQSSGQQQAPELHFPVTAAESKTPPVWLVVLSLIALVGLINGWNGLNENDRSIVSEVPEVPESLAQSTFSRTLNMSEYGPQMKTVGAANGVAQIEPASGDATSRVRAPVIAQAVIPPRAGVTLIVKEKTHIQIFNAEGKALVSRDLKAGDEFFVPDRKGYIMSLNNINGVNFMVDGVSLALADHLGKLTNGIPLDASALKNIVNPTSAQ